MLLVSRLRAGYARMAVLSGGDFHLGAGEIVAILGRNGVGKTTLVRTIIGLLPTLEGKILLEGHGDFTRWPLAHSRARARLAHVPEGRQIFPASPCATTCGLPRLPRAGTLTPRLPL